MSYLIKRLITTTNPRSYKFNPRLISLSFIILESATKMAQYFFLGYDAVFVGKYILKFQGHVLGPSLRWQSENIFYLEEEDSRFLRNAATYTRKQKALHSRSSNLVEYYIQTSPQNANQKDEHNQSLQMGTTEAEKQGFMGCCPWHTLRTVQRCRLPL